MLITNLLTLTLSAYCHCRACCGASGQPTASGKMPRAGATVALPRAFPLGSAVHIPSFAVATKDNRRRDGGRNLLKQQVINGYYTFIGEDRLAKRYDNRIDIFMASHTEAKNFGIKTNVTVKIISVK